jgi:LAS superfamily LD-carboxypeptidase LdcB
MVEFDKQPTTINEEPLHNNWVGLPNNSLQFNWLKILESLM